MDHHHNHQQTFDVSCDQGGVEPGELLEQGWFYTNLLDRKTGTRMATIVSDPCTLENQSYEETYAAINKLEKPGKGNLMRAPSMPERKQHPVGRRKSYRKTSLHNLLRAPSLPANLEARELVDEEEMEFSMGKLIRQASMNDSDRIPPRIHTDKGICQENVKWDVLMSVKPPQPLKPVNQRSLTDLECEDLQGFKNFGLDFNKTGLTTEKKSSEEDEPWLPQSSAPPVPSWVGKSSREDMKEQIKFWARAVASNVRQEC